MEHLAGIVREWTGAAVDLLFPPLCLACGGWAGDRRPLCDGCRQSIIRLRPPWCATCGRPFWTFAEAEGDRESPAAELCGPCRLHPPRFTYSRSAALYEGPVREALHALKFSGKTALAAPLGDLLLTACAAGLPAAPDLVVPVPLHRARERERGFNQAVLLGRRLARGLAVPFGGRALRRVRSTRPQAELSAVERRANVRGAFMVRPAAALRGRHVLLVDDVLTTGATVSECAQVVLAAGAASVGVLTVARATGRVI